MAKNSATLAVAAADHETGHELRQRILAASIELLEREGIAGLSMREVARRAGVSHQAPYHHFPDRESILAAIAEEGFARLTAIMVGPAADTLPPLARLERCALAYVDFALRHPAHFRVMFRPELVAFEQFPGLVNSADCAYARLETAVQEYIAGGRGWEGREQALIVTCWSMVHGLASLLLDGPLCHKQPAALAHPEELVKQVVAAFIPLLAAGHQRGPGLAASPAKRSRRPPARKPRNR